MILVDANLLLYAHDASAAAHAAARQWWEHQLSGTGLVRIAWSSVLAFVRIGTHPRVYEQPMSIAEARSHVDAWLARPGVDVLAPGQRHWSIFSKLLEQAQARGNLVTDAHLAALAIEHGATLCSTDRDFARFGGLRWNNPLAG